MYCVKRYFNPEIFQGGHKKRNYFEGWYFKIIDKPMKNIFSIIPGISLGKSKKERHSFIQVIDGLTGKVNYFKYDFSQFSYDKNKFDISIGENLFNHERIQLNLVSENISIKGKLEFTNIVSYPKSLFNPGIMGPYSFIPFMECYHGILNIHHKIEGYLKINEDIKDFNAGYGYIEKDWGRSFPESWVWLQSNHFNIPDVSVMFSVAKIPWFGRFFIGLISFLRIKENIYLFATYSKGKILSLKYEGNKLKTVVKNKDYRMELRAEHSKAGVLKAPKNGLMKREILESITATIKVCLYDKHGNMVFQGEGINAGMEIEKEILEYFQ